MIEFLIREADGGWFNLHKNRFDAVLRPRSISSHPVSGWGDHRIACEGVEVSFSLEDPWIQISFDADVAEDRARQIVEEIRLNLEEATGQKGRIVEL